MKTSNNGRLHQGKSVSCDCIKANSCIELADIRKLDSLLNQCESISCDNLLLLDEIYNYDLCAATKRKYASTSALHKILPKNSIRRRAHKKVLGIRENDSKIINFIDNKRQRDTDDVETDGEMTKGCEVNNDKCVDVDENLLLRTQSCTSLLNPTAMSTPTTTITDTTASTIAAATAIICCDKTIQTSYGDLYGHPEDIVCKYLSTDGGGACNNQIQPTQDKRKKAKRKQCSCRNYENVNFICETSLTTTPPNTTVEAATSSPAPSFSGKSLNPTIKSLMQLKRDKSDDRSSSGRSNRFTKQTNLTIDDEECGALSENAGLNESIESRVININEKLVEFFPISLNSSYSQSATPRGTSNNLHHDAKSDKSETQSQKSKRSKFSPSFISRKLTSRLNSEDDGAGGVKESLLGRSKSAEKKLPEPVETVRIDDDIIFRKNKLFFPLLIILMSFPILYHFFHFFFFIYCPSSDQY